MKKRLFFLIILTAVILYIIVFPRELKKEISFNPKWSTLLDSEYSIEDASKVFHFQVDDQDGNPFLGYVDANGGLLYRESVHYRAAVSDTGFINYSSLGGSLVLQDPSGRVMEICETNGFPFLKNGWFLVISSDRKGLSLMTWDGKQLWKNHFGSIVTSLDLNDDGLLLGFLNGEVVFLDRDGRIIFKREHRDTVVYGCALSYMEGGFAIISGISPQKILLYTFEGSDVTLLWERPLAGEFRTSRRVGFTEDNKYLYVEEKQGLMFYDLTGEEWGRIELTEEFQSGILQGEGELTYIFSGNRERKELKILEFGGEFGMDIIFPPDSHIIHLDSHTLLASGKGRLFRIDREVY